MMQKLEINNLHVAVEDKEILNGINLNFHPGHVHVIMGPNGAGKSTLTNALMGHPKYKITQGKIILDEKEITHSSPEVRSKSGLFLSFQSPLEIPGLKMSYFLRTILNHHRSTPLSVPDFQKLLEEKMSLIKIDPSFAKRYLNEGFSGGEKKRAEILQLMLLEPKYALLDETDSGLDVDSLRLVADSINVLKAGKTRMSIIVITHYQRFLEYLKPDEVSIIYQGQIIKQGGAELAKEIEQNGFANLIKLWSQKNN
ncbi:Fe-S cluster assembly ATPase SufC [Candidatus Woesearchaeota archaeon]|nr:Fe-S cluster assembly ATPase SufC [Candidatus Woesearchaeota archaeon]